MVKNRSQYIQTKIKDSASSFGTKFNQRSTLQILMTKISIIIMLIAIVQAQNKITEEPKFKALTRNLVSGTDPCTSYYSGSSLTSPQSAHCQTCASGYALLLLNPNSTICGTLNTATGICTIDSTIYPTLTSIQQKSFKYNSGAAPLGLRSYCFDCATYYSTLNSSVYGNCSSCAQQESNYESFATTTASYFKQSIISQSEGCSLCNNSITPATNYVSHSLVYQPWLQLYMRQCLITNQQVRSCNSSSYYNSTMAKCHSCSLRFPNCAACNSSQCLMCPDGYFWNPVVYTQTVGELVSVGMCVFGSCPLGTCKNMTLGHTQCTTPSSTVLSNCNKCIELSSSFTCQECVTNYQLQTVTKTCSQLSGTTSINLYVRSGAPFQSTSQTDATRYLSHDGTTASNAVYFIAQALYKAQQLLKQYQQVTANIYIGKGTHYLFFCDGSEVYDTVSTSGIEGTSQILKYCQYDTDITTGLGMLHRQYTTNDNLILNIKALECLQSSSLGMNSDLQFEALCIDWFYDDKPTILINQNNYYFNITGSATFSKILFRGFNPLVVPNNSSLTLSVIPTQFCTVSVAPTGGDGILKAVAVDIGDNPLGGFSCYDKQYTGSFVPSDTVTNRRCAEATLKENDSEFSSQVQSSLKCGGHPGHRNFFNLSLDGNNFYYLRTRSLFVLYSFADYQSARQAVPELMISECDFSYFYGNYDSLISVENNNIQKVNYNHSIIDKDQAKTQLQNITLYISNGQDRGAKITIANSNFQYARFCRGMIFYRTQPYINNILSFTNYTNLYIQKARSDKTGSQVLIYGSKFYMLNTYTNVTALAITGSAGLQTKLASSFENLYIQAIVHKGIVLNIEDFEGPVEILNCDFRQNWHFIPEILISNYTYGDTQSLSQFEDKMITKEFKFAICDLTSKTDKYLFKDGLNQDTNIDRLYDRFERLSVIYLSRCSSLVIIRDTTFLQNIGTFGGVISINSPNWNKGGTPYFAIQNNLFSQNFAYLSGNAIYIRFTKRNTDVTKICGSGLILNNQFSENIGMKIHNGGAISASCALISSSHQDYLSNSGYLLSSYSYAAYRNGAIKLNDIFDARYQIQYFFYKLNIQDNAFKNNYAGSKGSAVYLKHINDVRVSNCTFYQNGPVYAYTEYLISPIVKLLHKRALTYFDESETCFDDFDHLQKCATTNNYVQWAQIQGALYIENCHQGPCLNSSYPQYTNITTCDFNNNQVGPVIDFTFTNKLATSIYIVGGYQNYIQKCNIYNHYNLYKDYLQIKCPTLTKYYPSTYINFAMAPAIKITTSVNNYTGTPLYFNTTFFQNKFYNNDNVQILGLDALQKYKGSLISFNTSYGQDNSQFNSLLYLVDNDFSANRFIGNDTSLIYVGNGQLQILNSRFKNNGFLSTDQYSNSPSNVKAQSGQFIYKSYSTNWLQENGCILMENSADLIFGLSNEIKLSTFQYNFANKGAVMTSYMNGQFLSFLNNVHQWNIAKSEGALLYVRSTPHLYENLQRSTLTFSSDKITNLFAANYGLVSVTASQSNLISLIIVNCIFTDNFANEGSSLYLNLMAKVIIDQCVFTTKSTQSDLSNLVQSQYQTLYFKPFSNFIDIPLLTSIINPQSVLTSGYIVIKEAVNTQNVMFGAVVQQAATSSLIRYIQITSSQFYNQTAKTASALSVSGSYIFLSADQFVNNTQTLEGGVISASSNSILLAQGITISNCTSAGSGSALSMDQSQAVIFSSNFINNSASDAGTLSLSSYSQLNCNKCIFRNNQAFTGSAIASVNKKLLASCVILISHSLFVNNVARSSDLINLVNSNINLQDTYFYDNQAILGNNGLTLVGSSAILNNVTIDNYNTTQSQIKQNAIVDIGYISLSQYSVLNITNNTVIKNCIGSLAGLLSATSQSQVYIDNNTLISNNYSPFGSIMLIQGSQRVYIANSQLIDNNANIAILSIDQTENFIYNTLFGRSNTPFISGRNLKLNISNSMFFDSINQNSNGMGVGCVNCFNLNISNCSFQNLTAKEGGAIFLSSNIDSYKSITSINNCAFVANKAIQGGAIKIQDYLGPIQLQSNKFNNNQATLDPNKYSQYNKAQGGAIYFGGCYGEKDQNCNLTLIGSNKFNQNTAGDEGGAISRILKNISDDGTSTFSQNSAPYGSNIASFPNYIIMSTIISNTASRRMRLLQDSIGPIVTSGQPFQFSVGIYDQDNNLYTADSQSAAAIYPNVKVVSLQNNVVIAYKGIYNFSNVQVTAYPGTQVTFTINITGILTYGNQLQLPNDLGTFQITAGACQAGQYQTDSGSCFQCPEGFYSSINKNKQLSCMECPIHAICINGSLVGPKAGYQRLTNTSEIFYPCPNPDSCLAADNNNPLGKCNHGYEGYLCSKCQVGFLQSSIYECQECPSTGRSGIKITIVLLIMIGIIYLLVRSTLNAATTQRPIYTVYLKIMVNHFQLLGPITLINYNWNQPFYAIQVAQEVVSYLPDHVFKFDCLMSNNFHGLRIFYQKLLFYAFLPFILVFCALIFWVSYCLIIRSFYKMREYLASTILVMLFLVIPSIAHYTISTLSCINVNGVSRLRKDIEIVCFEKQHLGFLLGVALPSFLAWCIICPLITLRLLFKNRKHIIQIENQIVQSKADRFIIQLIRSKYGFLFNGYMLQPFYWEFVLFYRKILVITTVTLLIMVSAQIQILVALLIIGFSIILHLRYQPFYTIIMNRMELLSLIVISWTLYIGLFYASDYTEDDKLLKKGPKVFFFITILIPNMVFYFYWIFYTYIELLKMALDKSQTLFRFLTCGAMNVDSFKKRYCRDLTVYETPDKSNITEETPQKVPNNKAIINVNDFDGIQRPPRVPVGTERELISSSSYDDNHSLDKNFDKKDIIENQDNGDYTGRAGWKSVLSPDNIKLDFGRKANHKQTDDDQNSSGDENNINQYQIKNPIDPNKGKRKIQLFGDSYVVNQPIKQAAKVHPEDDESPRKQNRNKKRYQGSIQECSTPSAQSHRDQDNDQNQEDQENNPKLRKIMMKSMPRNYMSQAEPVKKVDQDNKYVIKDFMSSPVERVKTPKKHNRYMPEEESADRFIASSANSKQTENDNERDQLQFTQAVDKFKHVDRDFSADKEGFVINAAKIVKQKQKVIIDGNASNSSPPLNVSSQAANRRKARYLE